MKRHCKCLQNWRKSFLTVYYSSLTSNREIPQDLTLLYTIYIFPTAHTKMFDPLDLLCVFAADGALSTSRAVWRATPAPAEPPQVIGIIRHFLSRSDLQLGCSSSLCRHRCCDSASLMPSQTGFFSPSFRAELCDGLLFSINDITECHLRSVSLLFKFSGTACYDTSGEHWF